MLPETACDGVDSNGDGRVDEGVFAPRYVMDRDEAGAPLLHLYGAQAVAAPGVRWVQERSWTVDEDTDPRELYQMELDAQGRETGTLSVYVDRDGALRESLTQTVYDGDQIVYVKWFGTVDGVSDLDLEWFIALDEQGLYETGYVLVDGERVLDIAYLHDPQGRLIRTRSWTLPEGECSDEVVVYDDALNTQQLWYRVACEGEPEGEPNERRVWDEQGRLVDDGEHLWTWQEEGVASRIGAGADPDYFSYAQGRLTGAQYGALEESWTVNYDDSDRVRSLTEASNRVLTYQLEYADDQDEGLLSRARSFRDLQLWAWQEFPLDETGNLSSAVVYDHQGEAVSGTDWEYGCQPR